MHMPTLRSLMVSTWAAQSSLWYVAFEEDPYTPSLQQSHDGFAATSLRFAVFIVPELRSFVLCQLSVL